MTPSTPPPEHVRVEDAQAAINEMYDRCRELVSQPHPLMPSIDYFDYTLGTTSYVYSVRSWTETLAELRALRETVETIRRDCGAVCEEYETCTHAACQSSYRAWALVRPSTHASAWQVLLASKTRLSHRNREPPETRPAPARRQQLR